MSCGQTNLAATVGLIAVAALSVIVEAFWGESTVSFATTDFFSAALAVVAFVMLRMRKVSALATIFICGAIGIVWEFVVPFL